jgi:hypothetical protein
MQQKAGQSASNDLTEPLEVTRSLKYNAIEEEVIVGGRRGAQCSDDEDEHRAFGKHMFESKKAHMVACLLASARLIQTVCNEA